MNELKRLMFPHKCEEVGCLAEVIFDDEPKCFVHSKVNPVVPGYSAAAKAKESRQKSENKLIPEWMMLSDDELESRLMNRLSNDPFAKPLVRSYISAARDGDEYSIKKISEMLGE